MKKIFIRSLCVMFYLLVVSTLFADWRNYVWTYEYKVMKEEWLEFEHYLTLSSSIKEDMRGLAEVEHQLEVETGITYNTDIAIYQVFKQTVGSELKYKGYKLRLRHKLGEKNQYFVDMLGYLEYIGVPDFREHKIELKKIFAKDLGNFNIAFNTGFEIEKEDEWKYEYEYSLGMNYAINEVFKLGVEFKGHLKEHYVGPTLFIKLNRIFFTLGSAIALTEIEAGKMPLQIRLISGIGL